MSYEGTVYGVLSATLYTAQGVGAAEIKERVAAGNRSDLTLQNVFKSKTVTRA